MSFYGYKKNSTTTVVGAATSKDELKAFHEAVTAGPQGEQVDLFEEPLFVDSYVSDVMMHLTDDEFSPFPANVLIFEHSDAEQQDAFIAKHNILIGTHQRCVDRNIDMQNYDAPDPYDVDDSRTIAELHDLTDDNDRWDKRTDEEKEADKEMKKMMDELKKKGELSNDDSFSPKQNKNKNKNKDGDLHVSDIRTRVNADGSVDIDNILAHKYGEELTNAVLKMTFGDKTVSVDVNWKGRDIEGAEQLRDDVFFSDKYRDEYAAGHEPVFTIRTRDAKHESPAKFQEIVGEIVADIAKDDAPMVKGIAQMPHTADALKGGDDVTNESFSPQAGMSDEDKARNSDYLYAVYDEPDDAGNYGFALVHKDFWANEGCINDQHIEDDVVLPIGCYEEAESTFSSPCNSIQALDQLLENAGFVKSKELHDFVNAP